MFLSIIYLNALILITVCAFLYIHFIKIFSSYFSILLSALHFATRSKETDCSGLN